MVPKRKIIITRAEAKSQIISQDTAGLTILIFSFFFFDKQHRFLHIKSQVYIIQVNIITMSL